LSGGEQQMLAVARAWPATCKLLLLDEPYEGLAPVIVQEIERTLEEIKNLGITTIIVEQNAIAALHWPTAPSSWIWARSCSKARRRKFWTTLSCAPNTWPSDRPF
jgi:ABC-type antimicrobial peptide transport system ATPase subunit